MGTTEGSKTWLEIVARNGKKVAVPDGAASPDGRIWGCYLHGIFANTNFRRAWLASLGWQGASSDSSDTDDRFAQSLNYLADAVEASLDLQKLENIIWGI
jgi:adenosylcobyric acid synthase